MIVYTLTTLNKMSSPKPVARGGAGGPAEEPVARGGAGGPAEEPVVKKEKTTCRHGDKCFFLHLGRCHFGHTDKQKEEAKKLSKDKEARKAAIVAAKKHLAELRKKKKEVADASSALKAAAASVQSSRNKLKPADYATLKAEIDQRTKAQEQMRSELEEQMRACVCGIESAIKAAVGVEIVELKSALKSDMDGLKSDMDELKTSVSELQSAVSDLESDVKIVKSVVSKHDHRLKELTTEVAQLRAIVTQITQSSNQGTSNGNSKLNGNDRQSGNGNQKQ